ncbi:hypothetical protein [Streptomyces sp. NBC_00140]|uniref:hypothetical protein n=1 Tax=Streptomyces sp. NBC_00140 TaxID=2975664 RepID=UPI0022548882|nr:hypothetical protein [Streptomyces sp. NBC_00140]MCX5334220.1 hypothetical protein [Streptomyces sp. NBC_00140]
MVEVAEGVLERYAPELERWNAAFQVPYRLDPTGRKRIPLLSVSVLVTGAHSRDLRLRIDPLIAALGHHPQFP